MHSHSFASHKTDFFLGKGVAVQGLYEEQSDGNCTLGEGRGVETAVYTIQFFGRDFSNKHVIRPAPYWLDLSL